MACGILNVPSMSCMRHHSHLGYAHDATEMSARVTSLNAPVCGRDRSLMRAT